MPDPLSDPVIAGMSASRKAWYDQIDATLRTNLAAVIDVVRAHADADHGGRVCACAIAYAVHALRNGGQDALLKTLAYAAGRIVELEQELAALRKPPHPPGDCVCARIPGAQRPGDGRKAGGR